MEGFAKTVDQFIGDGILRSSRPYVIYGSCGIRGDLYIINIILSAQLLMNASQ